MVLLQRRFLRQPPWVANELWRRARAVPSLDLRFAETKSLNDVVSGQNLITFTRASSGTYVGSDGLIKTAAVNEPRFDHNPTTGESLGLLVEESRTNLLLRSEEFDNANWTKTASTVTANAITAPDGNTSADLLVPNTSNAIHYIQAAASITNGTSYTFSVYAKSSGSLSKIVLSSQYVSLFQLQAVFDLASGTVSSKLSQATAQITSMGNGWYRCSVTATSSDAGTVSNPMRIYPETTSAYTGDDTSGIYVWGAQLEAGFFPTSYIPTTSATVTRSADVASITGNNFTRWYRQDEGTMFAMAIRPVSHVYSTVITAVTDGTNSNRLFNLRQDGTSSVAVISSNSGINEAVLAATLSGGTSANNIAAAQKLNDSIVAANGVLGTSDTSVSMPTVNTLQIGGGGSLFAPYCGSIARLTYWQSRLPDSTLQGLTR